jgi:tetratricopeptide (TPR) repeat protein
LCRVAAKSSFDPLQEYQYFETAFDKYCVANNAKALAKLALLLAQQKLNLEQMWSRSQSQLFDLAEKCYYEAIRRKHEEKTLHELYHHFGDLLYSKYRLTRDLNALKKAGIVKLLNRY